MNKIIKIFNFLKGYPEGKRIFSFLVCRQAPYFSTIKPLFEELEPGRCVITMKKRKSVTNHLKTVHAIAMCNLVELAGGICTDVSIPGGVRWIPKGMSVEYLALAKSDLRGICSIDLEKVKTWDLDRDFPVEVNLYDTSGTAVMKGTITMHLSVKKKLNT